MIASRRSRCSCIHAIWSANTLGACISTVLGRLSVKGRSGVASTISATVFAISSAKSGSVTLNVSGEYSNRTSPSARSASRTMRSALCRASAITSDGVIRKTTSRHRQDVAWHRWTTARSAPRTASKVRSMSSGRAGVKTVTVTSSGIQLSATRWRTNSNSASLAEG